MTPSHVPLRHIRSLTWGLGIGLLAAALQWAVQPLLGHRVPFFFFLPALLYAAVRFGRLPAALVLLIGAVNAVPLMPPFGQWVLSEPADQAALALYLVLGAALVQYGDRLGLTTADAQRDAQRLQLAQDETGLGLFELDFRQNLAFVSPGLCETLGQPPMPGPIPLQEWLDALDAGHLSEARSAMDRMVSRGVLRYEREQRVRRPDGQERWLLSRVRLELDAQGRLARARGATMDVTASKQLGLELGSTRVRLQQQLADLHGLHELSARLHDTKTLQAQMQLILQALVDFHGSGHGALSLLNPDGTLRLLVSQGFEAQARQQLGSMVIGEAAAGRACGQAQRVVIEDTEHDERYADWRGFARQHGLRAVHSTPIIDGQGGMLGVIAVHFTDCRSPTERECTLADICSRKAAVLVERMLAQAALQESEARLDAVVDASSVPFIVMQPVRDGLRVVDFRWTYLNSAAARLLGDARQDLLGRCVREVRPEHWDHSGSFDHYVALAASGGTRQFEVHHRYQGIDGWFHCMASSIDGEVAVWFADVTESKRQEQLLQEADRRKDEFLATLAHELRNPLAPIRQAARLSNAAGATEAQKRRSHEIIERQVQHMALLLDDLLDVSRITRGVLTLRKVGTSLSAVIDSGIETARPLIDARGHRLDVSLPPQPVHFEADPLRIAQVVSNLLTNAAKYTPPGGHIRLQAEHHGDGLCIAVEDDGIGIEPAALQRVFQMFAQLDGTPGESAGGLGIGLALSRGLVELHGGRLQAHSDGPGLGSRFTLWLPQGDAGLVPQAPVDRHRLQPGVVRKVLLADDNRDAVESLAVLLELQGHQVQCVFDGEQALQAFDTLRPDVCLLDIGMPRLDGNQVAARIRAHPRGADCLLVALTGWGQVRDREQALAAGFDHHLTKPVDPDAVSQLVAGSSQTTASG